MVKIMNGKNASLSLNVKPKCYIFIFPNIPNIIKAVNIISIYGVKPAINLLDKYLYCFIGFVHIMSFCLLEMSLNQIFENKIIKMITTCS